jgi:type I restriction enzyme, S subunit
MSQSKKLIPRRRFKAFEDREVWSILKQLNEYAEILTGGTPSTQIKDFWMPKEVPWMSSGEINKKRIFSTDNMISQKGFDSSSARWIKEKSILIALAGQGKTRGKVAINELQITTNQSIAAVVPNEKLDSEFLFQNLGMRYEELRSISSGDGSRGGLNKKIISELHVTIPNIDEQKIIGIFFQKLDNLINTQQKKLEKAKTLKSAYLTEIFPNEGELKPKQRFIKFNDDWKVFLIKELGDIHTGNTPSTADKINWSVGEKGHVWVTPTDIKSLLISDSERYLTDIGWEKARKIPENSILITSIASIGKNSINTVPVAFNQQINAIIPYKNNAYFILSSMEKEKKRFSQLAGHTSMAIINKSEFENFTLIVPTEQEQTKIGNFFKLLDDKIALEQKKLDKLKNIKQAYLNEMFV